MRASAWVALAAFAALAGCGSPAAPGQGAAVKTAAPDAAPAAAAASVPERAWAYPVATVHPALHLVGDSTMADKPALPLHPERGWGQLLREFMQEPARVVNHAANGRSTKRFVDEQRWAHLLTQVQAGDVVVIQFGHNDQKADDPKRYAAADTDFKNYLRRFVAELRARQVVPVLATSVARRKFDSAARVQETLAEYTRATREVATELRVPLIDMDQRTRQFLQQLGPEASKPMFMWIPPGAYASLPQGRQDDTHYVESGARAAAKLAAQALREQVSEVRPWLK